MGAKCGGLLTTLWFNYLFKCTFWWSLQGGLYVFLPDTVESVNGEICFLQTASYHETYSVVNANQR